MLNPAVFSMMDTEESACPQCGYFSKRKLPVSPSDSSRIAELCSTSQCPTVEEEKSFQSFVGEGQSFLNDLDTRIALMKTSIQALENTRELLKPVVMQYKESLNPIRRVPSDVWGHIFFYGAGYDKDHEEYFDSASHSLDLNSPPWVYGRVCRQWKDIIHNMPSLWTRYNPLTAFPALTALLDSLSCPVLTHLTVIASGIISDAVKRFEMRSKFQLEHLIVGRDAGKFVKGLLNPLCFRKSLERMLKHLPFRTFVNCNSTGINPYRCPRWTSR
ncbi:uncharacterized protein C8R40DRAFT_642462 [Lentinula edodes]|uniref:uncharacterized protein n=1 Tax=Lentinula edodes TaxID=5353 RepID=UPI001E8DEC54|nr:uncharacterized protein C8R40DRAFT_642462 [Lentinula edodes]KAH7870524.1 hypothetical protein C8R40DRAFT_642462 [Lentinula edodes]